MAESSACPFEERSMIQEMYLAIATVLYCMAVLQLCWWNRMWERQTTVGSIAVTTLTLVVATIALKSAYSGSLFQLPDTNHVALMSALAVGVAILALLDLRTD